MRGDCFSADSSHRQYASASGHVIIDDRDDSPGARSACVVDPVRRLVDERSELRHRHFVPADVERRDIDGRPAATRLANARCRRRADPWRDRCPSGTGRPESPRIRAARRQEETRRPDGSPRSGRRTANDVSRRRAEPADGCERAWIRTAATIATSVASTAQPIHAARSSIVRSEAAPPQFDALRLCRTRASSHARRPARRDPARACRGGCGRPPQTAASGRRRAAARG